MDRRTDCHGRTPARLPASDAEPDAAPSILRRGSILVQQSPVGYFCIGFGEAARTLRFVFDDGPAACRAFGDPAHLAAALDREDIAAAPVIGPAAALAEHGDRHLNRLAALGELAKSGGYDPNEPRDDHGRWTSEGGGTGDGASARLFREIAAFLAATAHDDAATGSVPDRHAIGREGDGYLNADFRTDPQSGVEPIGSASQSAQSSDEKSEYNPDFPNIDLGPWSIFGTTFVFDKNLGNDAHKVLRSHASAQGPEWFGGVSEAPDGTVFKSGYLFVTAGFPDLGDTSTHQIWEVKSWNSAAAALPQVYDYSISTSPGLLDPPKYRGGTRAPSFFSGNTLQLPGAYGTINYDFIAYGVILYTYNTNKSVVRVPSFLPLLGPAPGGFSSFVPVIP